MSAATMELVHLIDLSLGSEPSGVVNFNYLHTLMHAIVRRLGTMEQGTYPMGGGTSTIDGVGGTRVGERGIDGVGRPRTGQTAVGTGTDGVSSVPGGTSEKEEAGGTKQEKKETSPTSDTDGVSGGTSERGKVQGEGDGAGGAEQAKKEPSPTSTPPPSALADSKPSSSHASRTHMGGSVDQIYRPKSSFVTAANDLGAMERKLQELENRLNTMDSLPELLERKSSDKGATPIKDRWNFTNLSKRLSAVEDGLEQNATLVDDLLGEVQSIKSSVTGCEGSLSQLEDKLAGDISGITEKLEGLRLSAAKDSMGDAAAAMLNEFQSKIESLQTELSAVKASVESLDLSPYATTADLQSALQQQSEASESALKQSTEVVAELGGRMDGVETDLARLTEQIDELQTTKLNISDMASMMPQDTGEAAGLLTKLVELQNKVAQIEGEMNTLPPDVLDQIAAMQKAIDKLTADLASLSSQMGSSSEERSRLEELGSEVAQLRERMSEVDRAVTALTDTVSTMRTSPGPADEEGEAKYADLESFAALQEALTQQQQEHERLIGTVAHFSNEMEISKEHIKALYSSVDELRATKVDKEQLEVEVREKADRAALEGKASREWVDSTFERLDQQIREARDKLLGQEEALRSAVTRLDEDVETKLDRMELEPLKDYFDKKLARVKTAPVVEKEAALAEDAAGFRKPLRFRCISCDKPLGMKTGEAIPALPSIANFPGTRSFRPYTTYELELIRRHQRMGLPVFGPLWQFSRGSRSAGGSHTLTQNRRRIRVAPLSSAYSPEPYTTPPSRISGRHEVEITGHNGHIYKGRASKLPPLKDDTRRGRASRPTTTPPYQQ